METVWASGGNVDESAAYLGLRPDQVRAAISYYAEFPGEIDHWIQRNHDEADRLYLQWGRRASVSPSAKLLLDEMLAVSIAEQLRRRGR